MGKAAVAVLMVALIIGAGVGVAYAAGVFNNSGGGGSDDDWKDHVGEVTIFETEGTESVPAALYYATYTGTATNTLLYMDEKTGYWFINYAYERTYKSMWEQWKKSGDSNEWGLDSDYKEEVIEEKVTINTKYYGQKECTHIRLTNDVTGHTEDQWTGIDDGITYYVEANTVTVDEYLREAIITSKLYYKSSEKVDVKIEFEVDIYTDEGITVTGEGKYQIGQEVTLTASGDNFYGWYDFDVSASTPVSTDSTYKFNITSDKVLYALNEGVDKTYTSGKEVTLTAGKELSSATWEITPFYRNNGEMGETITVEGAAPTYVFESPGDYYMKIEGTTADGKEYNGYRILYVDGYLECTWEFKYDDMTITDISLDILFSDYVEYMDKLSVSERADNSKERQKHDSQFVVVDKYITRLAEQFKALQAKYGWTDIETAGCILAFTQYIPYQYDSDTHGESEYWNFPVETLYLNMGDCEDTSILTSAIYKAMGYESALILMSGHMAVGILGTDLSGYSDFKKSHNTFSKSGYYYGETTSTTYELGEVPSGVRYVDKVVISVED
ncbi:MAG: hypothetical protein IKQ93_01330 [Candidatus Methanomethylophilaceae archaeon]|nr:hypothetical protein [Candidatus Methanomethylophilaceae archaeon]